MEVIIFGIKLTLNPIAFHIFGWPIYWYGILIAVGFLLAVIYGLKVAGRFNIDKDRMLDVIIFTTPISILSARLYYVLFDPDKSITTVKEFFGIGSGSGFQGLAIYGGVIGACLGGILLCYIRKVNFFDILDVAAPAFLIGQAIGRWGNFINQEAFGSLTHSSFWGMQSANTIAKVGEGMVHPCFLYESIWCVIGFFVLESFSKKRKFRGQIALLYGIWYGFGRALIEPLRTDSLFTGKIKVSFLLSVILCLTCIVLYFVFRKRSAVKSTEKDYRLMFENEENVNIEEHENESGDIAVQDEKSDGEVAPGTEE